MLDITILAIGKIKEPAYLLAYNNYLLRLKPYARIKVVELDNLSFSKSNSQNILKRENERIKEFLEKNKDKETFLLSEFGREYGSLEFSKKVLNPTRPLLFVVFGALGIDQNLFKKYNKLSLSRLTFPHELARVILLEQIYRGITILENKTYHY